MRPPKIQLDTKAGIARRIGVSRTTLDGYLKKPGAPEPNKDGLYDPNDVTAFIGGSTDSDRTRAKVDGTLKSLKARELKLKCDRLQIKLDEERGLYFNKADANAEAQQIGASYRALLQRKLEMELPPKLIGLDQIAIAERMKAVVDEICDGLTAALAPWT